MSVRTQDGACVVDPALWRRAAEALQAVDVCARGGAIDAAIHAAVAGLPDPWGWAIRVGTSGDALCDATPESLTWLLRAAATQLRAEALYAQTVAERWPADTYDLAAGALVEQAALEGQADGRD